MKQVPELKPKPLGSDSPHRMPEAPLDAPGYIGTRTDRNISSDGWFLFGAVLLIIFVFVVAWSTRTPYDDKLHTRFDDANYQVAICTESGFTRDECIRLIAGGR